MTHKVVIIGHGFTSRLAVTRSVAQIGCEITLIVMTGYRKFHKNKLNMRKPIDGYSKYVSRILYCYKKDGEGLIRLLLNECVELNKKVIIIPDSDFSAAVVDNNQERLRDHFLFPHIQHTSGAIVEWMNKMKQKTLAQEIGMNVVPSCVINIKNGEFSIPSKVNYPCFTKPLSTINGGGKRIFSCCRNEKELRTLLEFAATISDMQVLVEDFMKIETEYAVVGFTNGKEVIIPGIIQILEMTRSGHYGVARQGIVMPTIGFEEQILKFKQFVLEVGLVGVFDIDFYKNRNKFFFGELNLRFGGSGYAITKKGVNLPGMLVNTLMHASIDNMQKIIYGTETFVNERMLLDDWLYYHISTKEFHKQLKAAQISFVKDDIDTAPQKEFSRLFWRQLAKRMIKKVIGRR